MTTRAERLTQTQQKRELYSDMLSSFAKHPLSGDLARATNEDAVKQAVKNIVLTNLGERPFEPNLGADVRRALFEQTSGFTEEIVAANIRSALSYAEPRILLLEVVVREMLDSGEVMIKLTFALVNDRVPISLDVIVKRA